MEVCSIFQCLCVVTWGLVWVGKTLSALNDATRSSTNSLYNSQISPCSGLQRVLFFRTSSLKSTFWLCLPWLGWTKCLHKILKPAEAVGTFLSIPLQWFFNMYSLINRYWPYWNWPVFTCGFNWYFLWPSSGIKSRVTMFSITLPYCDHLPTPHPHHNNLSLISAKMAFRRLL